MSATILLVDPDIKVHQALIPYIEEATYELLCVYSAKQALAILEQRAIDLVITELILPDMSGFLFLNQVKYVANIVVYTEQYHEEVVLRIFEEGADDFATKSLVSIAELIHRLRVILRRRKPTAISLKNIQLDIQLQRAWWKGVEIDLNRQRFLFLLELLRYPNTVRTKSELLSVVSKDLEDIDYRILYVIVYAIRQQIEENPDKPQYLLNVRGVGYIFKS